MELNIGTLFDTGKPFKIPDDAVTQTFAILAIKGAGKTSTAVVMAEEMHAAGHQIVVIDPTDVWWGLRSSADGKSAGLRVYVFGGNHPDFPLDAGKGAEVANIVVETGISCVLALRHLSKSQQRTFVAEFAERLYRRKGELQYQTPVHVFIDEADAFAPQRVMGESARCLGAIDDLVRRARNSGVGTTLITQKPATLNKDVLEMADTLIVLRIVGVPSRKAVDEWLSSYDVGGQRKDFMASLAGLKRGEAWAWSPSWLNIYQRIQVRRRHTFDSSATPKAGEKRIEPRKLANVDLDKIRERMAVVVKEAEARDPKALQARVRELEREVVTLTKRTATKPCDHDEREIDELRYWRDEYADMYVAARKCIDSVEAAVLNFHTLNPNLAPIENVGASIPAKKPPVARSVQAQPIRQATPRLSTNGAHADLEGLRGGAVRMLERICSTYPAKWTQSQIGALTGFTPGGGTFGQYMRELIKRGFVDKDGREYAGTEAGINALGGKPPAPSDHDEVMAMWRGALRGGAYKMLEIVVTAGDRGVDNATLAAESGFEQSGGTFGQYRRSLVRNGLVEDRGGVLVATDVLFP